MKTYNLLLLFSLTRLIYKTTYSNLRKQINDASFKGNSKKRDPESYVEMTTNVRIDLLGKVFEIISKYLNPEPPAFIRKKLMCLI